MRYETPGEQDTDGLSDTRQAYHLLQALRSSGAQAHATTMARRHPKTLRNRIVNVASTQLPPEVNIRVRGVLLLVLQEHPRNGSFGQGAREPGWAAKSTEIRRTRSARESDPVRGTDR